MENWLAFAGGILGGVIFAAFWYATIRWWRKGERSLL